MVAKLSLKLNPLWANAHDPPGPRRVMHALMETSAGNITIELYHGSAPDTVANFVRLVEMGHYDCLLYTSDAADE